MIKVCDVKKLILNLGNKAKYVLHYKNLQLYLSLEMKLTKIHRVLQFKQSDWMKKNIDFKLTLKKECMLLIVLKKILKLMINSAYVKVMENLRKRINVRLVNNKKKFLNTPADQLILLIKYLVKIMLLFMKLNQF